ncbi:MAG TPA: hypothetical protein VKB75_16305, partial [Jatrophihabitans sp.]|nr:hypothetical protein [Jatrophihabitans sp.]
MSRIAVVGDDVLAVALARQLATSTAEVAHHPLRSLTSVRGVHSTLRLLSPVAEQLNRERTAMSAWRSLETETGAALLTGVDAVEVGPASTVAATLRATLDGDAAAPMSPMEAARRWPAIRFDGTVAHQPAARRIDLALARTALRRSAVSLGARFATAPVKRAWLTTSGEVELLDAQGWHHYDAAVVVTDSRDRAALGCLPTDLAMSTVLTVSPIGPAAGWPSVVHHTGLPADPDGFRIAGACAEVQGSRVELALTIASGTDAAGLLWEYAVRWLPGTIVGG